MKELTVAADNEKTMLAFADWLHGYVSALLSEEKRTACVSAVRVFAEFIAPGQLSDSTVAEIKAFEQDAKTNPKLEDRERRARCIGISYFRSFRKEFLKPLPKGKIPASEVRRLLASTKLRRIPR